MLWDRVELTESFLDKVNIFLVVLDATGNNEALLRSDVVHNELLDHASINVIEVLLEAEAGHAKGVVSVSSSEEEVLVLREGVVLMEVLVEIVGLLVL